MQYKSKHRLSAALMAGAMCCTMIPAASADEIATPETAEVSVPEVTDSAVPDISQITENLYNDLPDAPTGSYLGSMGLPVATGETKISISAWVSDLYDGVDAHMDADALNADESIITIGKNSDADYAIIPLLVQTEYPANGATAKVVLPEGVEVLSYSSTDADLIPASDAELSKILHQTYAEQSAAATGFYVRAFSDFTAQVVYASPDGTTLQKSIHVQLSDEAAPTQLYTDNGVATLAAGPTPPYATIAWMACSSLMNSGCINRTIIMLTCMITVSASTFGHNRARIFGRREANFYNRTVAKFDISNPLIICLFCCFIYFGRTCV